MNNFFAVIAILGGVAGSLLAYRIVPLTMIGSFDMEEWHDKFGKTFKILGPAAVIVGLLILLF